MVKELWEAEYKPVAIQDTTASIPAKQTYEDEVVARMSAFINCQPPSSSTPASTAILDGLELFLETDSTPWTPQWQVSGITLDVKVFDSLRWWLNRQDSYPCLSKMAFDTCAIPLMSDDPDRAFSSGRNLITFRRNALHSDLVERLELLRNWYPTPTPVRMRNKRQNDDNTDNTDNIVDMSRFDDDGLVQMDLEDSCDTHSQLEVVL